VTEIPTFRLPEPLCAALATILRNSIGNTPAHAPHGFTIGGESDPYLRRWFVTPRGDGPACYLHQFLRDDDDRALHDHPWASCGIILAGGYVEQLPTGTVERQVGDVIVREPEHRHRVILHRDAEGHPIPAWTLFLVGPRAREWGFWCPGHGGRERFVHWRDFTAGENGELVGKGCDA
jgi:hypothetical protein